VSTDPIARFHELFAQAQRLEPTDATAMSLATADAAGRPSVRMVLLKSADEEGFVFYTNLTSRKARELSENPWAALCFHWPTAGHQVRIEGPVSPVADVEADVYFASRPRGSQIGAWTSRQSATMPTRESLLDRYARMEQRFEGGPVPRPPFWSGYRLRPDRIELWTADTFRLHHRTLYTRTAQGWTEELLQP
jgi:pyridoxamine 5'-phosphate oxidase